jgi:hypothetical protein
MSVISNTGLPFLRAWAVPFGQLEGSPILDYAIRPAKIEVPSNGVYACIMCFSVLCEIRKFMSKKPRVQLPEGQRRKYQITKA